MYEKIHVIQAWTAHKHTYFMAASLIFVCSLAKKMKAMHLRHSNIWLTNLHILNDSLLFSTQKIQRKRCLALIIWFFLFVHISAPDIDLFELNTNTEYHNHILGSPVLIKYATRLWRPCALVRYVSPWHWPSLQPILISYLFIPWKAFWQRLGLRWLLAHTW